MRAKAIRSRACGPVLRVPVKRDPHKLTRSQQVDVAIARYLAKKEGRTDV